MYEYKTSWSYITGNDMNFVVYGSQIYISHTQIGLSLPAGHISLVRQNPSLVVTNVPSMTLALWSHWFVAFHANGTQVIANTTSPSMLVPISAGLDVYMIYNLSIATVSPSSAYVYVGQTPTFVCTRSDGSLPYSYQWYLNGNAVGTNSTNYTFNATQVGSFSIWCNVTDSTPSTVKSNIATVTAVISLFPISPSPSSSTSTTPSAPSPPSLSIILLAVIIIAIMVAGALIISIIYTEKEG